MMMVKIVDHLVQGLAIDIEKKKQEGVARQRLETQLYRLLSEMLETERKYVSDLEQVRKIFISKFEIFSLARTWLGVFIIILDVALTELHSDMNVFLPRSEVLLLNIFLLE